MVLKLLYELISDFIKVLEHAHYHFSDIVGNEVRTPVNFESKLLDELEGC
jgi:hypothetical protein